MTYFEVSLGEIRFPLVRELVEPEFEGFRGINALGAVRLHTGKREKRRVLPCPINLNLPQLKINR
jgi:hypothetical protein